MTMDKKEREKLIERYAIGPAVLREALAKAPERMRKWRPEPEEFSVHEIIVHCADSETNSHGRIRYLMTEDNATIIGYDPPTWAAAFHYLDHPIDAAMLTVEAVRANTVPILKRASEEEWAHVGTHTESGAYSAEDWLRTYAAHCHDHAKQIEAVIEAWTASQA
jgi:hypothetical protein